MHIHPSRTTGDIESSGSANNTQKANKTAIIYTDSQTTLDMLKTAKYTPT